MNHRWGMRFSVIYYYHKNVSYTQIERYDDICQTEWQYIYLELEFFNSLCMG